MIGQMCSTTHVHVKVAMKKQCIHLIPSEVPSLASRDDRAPERKSQRTGSDETT